ncbi:hypothetical protein DCAR_0730117 [Daucus carota subsp. sativus]|uniref:Uncharacterized protein n=1 Tax=Daucus carota subsp. sativus TaxID=79200 RepID=A0A164UP50_DAUCS|nr:hypothetical protein DCAR_0730117 [Daucus carota subsp. sativus]
MEKNRALKEKFKELEQHEYWDHSNNSSSVFDLMSRSPRELMSSLQDEEEELLSSNVSSVCSDCLEDEESEDEEVRSVVVSSGSVYDDKLSNEDVDNGINRIYEEGKKVEINKVSLCNEDVDDGINKIYDGGKKVEISKRSSADVKNAEKIRKVGWEFSVLISVLVLIGLVIAVMFSVRSTWYVDQGLDQASKGPYHYPWAMILQAQAR